MKKFLDIGGKVLLFDFDGTLVVTEVLARKVIAAYFEERSLTVPSDFPDLIIGRTWRAAIETMGERARNIGLELGPLDALVSEFQRRYQESFLKGVPLVPGFLEVLPKIKEKARFIGIVTGSDRHEVLSILKAHQLEKEFGRIWAAGEYEFSKPHPAPYLKALADLGVSPEEVLVFEDSKAGMESANQAGLKWVQISHESHAGSPDPRSILTIRDWTELSIP
jgi:HAD superfamily hydrolase (TIGR01509 family)